MVLSPCDSPSVGNKCTTLERCPGTVVTVCKPYNFLGYFVSPKVLGHLTSLGKVDG